MSLLLNNLYTTKNEETVENNENYEIVIDETEVEKKNFSIINLNKFRNIIINKISALNYIKKDKISRYEYNKNYLIKKHKTFFIENYKKNRTIDYSPILYIIHISFLKKNTTIHVTDIKGKLKIFCSASYSLKLEGKQKTKQPKAISALLKYFFRKKVQRLKKNIPDKELLTIALHLKYVSKNFIRLITQKLKDDFQLKLLNYFNFYPHNGCRPRKLKRVKRRKKKIDKNIKNDNLHLESQLLKKKLNNQINERLFFLKFSVLQKNEQEKHNFVKKKNLLKFPKNKTKDLFIKKNNRIIKKLGLVVKEIDKTPNSLLFKKKRFFTI
jgi:ribosomal protein S11